MQVPFDIKNEIVLCQQELKISITLHQAIVQKYKCDPNNQELLSKMIKIENDMKGISRKQKPLLVRLRRELDKYQNKLKSENKIVDYAADNENVAKQIEEHQRMADFKLIEASSSKIISCGIKNPENDKIETIECSALSNEEDQQQVVITDTDAKRSVIEQSDSSEDKKKEEILWHLGLIPIEEMAKLVENNTDDEEVLYIPRVKDENRKRGSERHKISHPNPSKLHDQNGDKCISNLQSDIAERNRMEYFIKTKNELLENKQVLYQELPILEDKLKELTEQEGKQREETKRLLQEQENIEHKIKVFVDFIKFVQQTSPRSFPLRHSSF